MEGASATEPESYRVQRLREALAQDPRVGALDVQVHVVAGKVFLTGSTATQQRLDSVTAVATEVLPDHDVHNEMVVAELADLPAIEKIR